MRVLVKQKLFGQQINGGSKNSQTFFQGFWAKISYLPPKSAITCCVYTNFGVRVTQKK